MSDDTDIQMSLIPPKGWKELDMSPEHRERQIAEALLPLRSVTAQWNVVYPQLRRYLAGAYAQAWDSGVRYALTSVHNPQGLTNIIASFMVSIVPSASVSGAVDEELETIAQALLDEKEALLPDESLNLRNINLEGAGRAIQVASIKRVPLESGDDPDAGKIAMLRTFIPFNHKVVLATGVTPQAQLAQILFELFGKITGTISLKAVPRRKED